MAKESPPPPTYDDIFLSDSEELFGPEPATGGESGDDELPPVPTQPFSGSDLFSAEPDPDAPGGLIFPDLPNVGGAEQGADLFGEGGAGGGAKSASARVESSSTASSSRDAASGPVSGYRPFTMSFTKRIDRP